MKNILIVSDSCDLHADLVQPLLVINGGKVFRLNLDHFPRDYSFDLHYHGESLTGTLYHIPSGDKLLLSEVTAVWLRKDAEFTFVNNALAPQEKAFAIEETQHTLLSLLYSLPVYWMNHPKSVRGAMWKGEQIQRAAKLGFKVPKTLITNNADAVHSFKQQLGRDIIFKTMSSPYLAADKVGLDDRIAAALPTTLVTNDMMQQLDAVKQVPCLFQEYIAKQYELRVTVIGDKVFSAKIHSQEDGRTQTDCRDMSAEITYEAYQLPAEIRRRCLQLLNSYQLNYGALDFIVTPENDYVFLENNPGGQFLFVEQLVPEFKMLDCVSQTLINA